MFRPSPYSSQPSAPRVSVRQLALVRIPIGLGLTHWGVKIMLNTGAEWYFESSKAAREVRVSDRRGFAGNAMPVVVARTANVYEIAAAVDRMNAMLGDQYRLLSWNCEKTAKTAFYGEGTSEQAKLGSAVATGLGLLALGATAPVAILGGAIAAAVAG